MKKQQSSNTKPDKSSTYQSNIPIHLSDSWLSYLKRYLLIPVICMTCMSSITIWTWNSHSASSLQAARASFEQVWNEHFHDTQREIHTTFSLTYDAIRTMAVLPGVVKIDRYAENFVGDPHTTVQQIYNNIASHVAVSEIYIVPADLEPDQIDPVTGKLQEPITTYDQIIVGKSADGFDGEDHEELEEVEIYEYRQMKEQCRYFKEHFPNRSSIKGLNFPAISSPAVITCDNTEFSKAQLDAHDDSARLGIIYSVPFYGPNGKFKGLVSSVLRTRVLAKLLPEPYFLLTNDSINLRLVSTQTTPENLQALKSVKQDVHVNQYSFTRSSDCPNVIDTSPWVLTAAVPDSLFESYPQTIAARTNNKLTLITGLTLSLLISAVIWSLSSTRTRALDIAKRMTQSLRESEEKTRLIIDTALDAVVTMEASGVITGWNNQAELIFGLTKVQAIGKSLSQTIISPQHRQALDHDLKHFVATGQKNVLNNRIEITAIRDSSIEFPIELSIAPHRTAGSYSFSAFIRDISERKKAEKERNDLQQQLLTVSRQAGKAEIATGILHNVGNVLNSVNISATLIQNKLLQSKAPNLGKAANMLQEHHQDIAQFLTNDDKGKQLPIYLAKLADVLVQEQNTLLSEIQSMNTNLDHVKKVVSAQQEYAKVTHVTEEFNLGALLEEAIKISDASLERHSIKVLKRFEQNPQVIADKHLVFQILINLVTNAKKALRDSTQPNKCITLTLGCIQKDGLDFVKFQVQDNGVGIPQENLNKIFTHGFTTRDDGHGFGLHNSANAARQMNGSLTAESPGPNLGATFTLEIPLQPQRA